MLHVGLLWLVDKCLPDFVLWLDITLPLLILVQAALLDVVGLGLARLAHASIRPANTGS